jgi:RecA DNA recombination protein
MANLSTALSSDPRWKNALELAQTIEENAFPSLSIPALNHLLINGLTRGTLVEASGSRSSGKSSLCMHILARATQNGEVCAVVDFANSFHPDSAFACGVQLDRVLWIRCKCNPEYTMKTADLLLHSGGFGVVLLDLSEISTKILNRIPISYWYRFQRAVQNTPTVLLVCANAPQAKAASRDSIACQATSFSWIGQRPFSRLNGLITIARQRKLLTMRPVEPLQILVA